MTYWQAGILFLLIAGLAFASYTLGKINGTIEGSDKMYDMIIEELKKKHGC